MNDEAARSGHNYYTTLHDDGLLLVDLVAESTVAGCAIASHDAALAAHRTLFAEDFADPRLWRIVEVAAALDPALYVDEEAELAEALALGQFGAALEGCVRRLRGVAARTGYDEAWLRKLVAERAVLADSSGWHRDRVLAAAAARRQLRAWLDDGEALGIDTSRLTRGDPTPAIAAGVERVARHLGNLLVGQEISPNVDAAADVLASMLVDLGWSDDDAYALIDAALKRHA